MWPKDSVAQLFGTVHPIIQAPMGGVTTPALVAAVSNAGGLGSLACGALPAETIRDQVGRIREATNRPFNVNFFVHKRPTVDTVAAQRSRDRLSGYYAELGLGAVPEPSEPFLPFDEDRLGVVLQLRPRVVSFHFGLPSQEAVRKIKDAGSLVISSATTVAEARDLEKRGIDAIIAQGVEAGGHRGTFSEDLDAGSIGTFALVPQIVDAVRIPVIAAGGIGDARGIAAAFALGARGVQMGTAFLGCPEASVAPAYRKAVLGAAPAETRLTRAFTGRPARTLRCRLTEELADADALAFPLQASLLVPIWGTDNDAVRRDFMPFWAGQSVALTREIAAGDLIEKLATDAQAMMPH